MSVMTPTWTYMRIREKGFCRSCGRRLEPGDAAIVGKFPTKKGGSIYRLLCAKEECASKTDDAAAALERALARRGPRFDVAEASRL